MGYYSTNELKYGTKILHDGDPCTVLENEYVKPGKNQAFNRLTLRKLKTGRVIKLVVKSGERVESADIIEIEVDYLYQEGDQWHFMESNTYEQYVANEKAVEDARYWLKPQVRYTLILFNGEPLSVIPPNFIVLCVKDTDPGVRGDTSGGGSKPATLETGIVVRVPLFVQIGEYIKVDTRDGTYLERAKAS